MSGARAARRCVARWVHAVGARIAPPHEPDECEQAVLQRLTIDEQGRIDFAIQHSAVKALAGTLASWFDALGGPGNYVETQMVAPDGRMFLVTVQDVFRPTPHELRVRAENELTAARAAIEKATTPGGGNESAR